MELIALESIESKIYFIRGQKVMLDRDLAVLYGVPTFRLNEAVKRGIKRFPSDFMFRLTSEEVKECSTNLRSQFAISSYGGRRYLPHVFTEQGVAMLSSVLNSDRAIQVNIAIMRVFSQLKEVLGRRDDLAAKLSELESKVGSHDDHIRNIFHAIKQLIDPKKPRIRIGFKPKS